MLQKVRFTHLVGAIATVAVISAQLPTHASEPHTHREANRPTSGEAIAAQTTSSTGTIVDIAVSNESFSTLVAAVEAAELVETLSGEGPFTLFAPTNEAFAALPAGTLETLLMPENQALLQRILTYHVVAGAVESSDIQPGAVATVEGNAVQLDVANGQVNVGEAIVQVADIEASNGVIHVIDQVLLPPDL